MLNPQLIKDSTSNFSDANLLTITMSPLDFLVVLIEKN